MTDLALLTIHDLAPLIARRDVSPVEITESALRRIDEMDGQIRAFITLKPDEALAQARAAEAEIANGAHRGPLHGVPMAIKDNIAVAGWPTTNGSALMTDFVTHYDATAVARLRDAGAVIVGKNNMHEWAMGGTSAKSAFGSVRNPWDVERTAGGSSGGSAAAVSASLIYGSIGTDNKGSVRVPASYCGIVGMKPTYGLVSRFGQLPPSSATTDHIGPLAKDVTDTAILLSALAGYDNLDPTSLESTDNGFLSGINDSVRGIRIGVPKSYFFEQTDAEVADRVRAAIEVLAAHGAELREVDLPSLQYMTLIEAAWFNEGRSYLLPYAKQGPSMFADESIWERTILGELVRASDFTRAARLRSVIRAEFDAAMKEVDLIATPTNMTAAFPAEAAERPRAVYPSSTATVLTSPWNLVGCPAISVPCGFTAHGMPVSLMLAGRHWEDDLVLRAARTYEQAAGSQYTPPPLALESAII